MTHIIPVGETPARTAAALFPLIFILIHKALNRTVSGEEKASCLRWESASPVMFHLSDPVGIIPWNATPGKACGATLGDICNTSEVRGQRPDLFPSTFPFLPPTNLTFPSTVLPVLSPLHCRVGRRRGHRHCTGKPLVIPLITCFSKYARCHGMIIRCRGNLASHVFRCVIPPAEVQTCRLPVLHECVHRQGQCFTRPAFRPGTWRYYIKKLYSGVTRSHSALGCIPANVFRRQT